MDAMAGQPIGVAIVGTGKVADAHALGFRALPECRIARVADMDRPRAEAFAHRYEARPAATLDEMLDDPNVQVVSICTPHPSHAELAIKALSAGRHVLVEKPMALTTVDCDRMNAAAREAGVNLSVVSQRRWYAPIRRMREALDDGRIGAPILSTLELLGWRGPEYYAMDPWRGTWKGEGGGVLVTQAIHYLDLLQWLAGPARVVTGRHSTFNHPDIEVEDTAVAIVEFASGGLGSIIASNSQRPGLWARIRVHGRSGASIGAETERGSVFISGVTASVVEPALTDVWTIPGEESSIDRWRAEDVAEATRVDAMTYYHGLQIADFVDAIQEGRAPLVTGVDGRAAVALFEAIYQSQATHQAVEISHP
jgi:UDP-N-acetyl-2-amino-2-deoxyglucuronate dehydrogenase